MAADLMAGLDRLIDEAESDVNTLKDTRLKLQGRKRAGRKPGPKPGAKRHRTTRTRAKRRNTRADQALLMIQEKPGIGAAEIAKSMKIQSNYLYRVLGRLEDEGKIKKTGARSYDPVASTA